MGHVEPFNGCRSAFYRFKLSIQNAAPFVERAVDFGRASACSALGKHTARLTMPLANRRAGFVYDLLQIPLQKELQVKQRSNCLKHNLAYARLALTLSCRQRELKRSIKRGANVRINTRCGDCCLQFSGKRSLGLCKLGPECCHRGLHQLAR